MSAYRNRNAQQMDLANNGLAMAQQAQSAVQNPSIGHLALAGLGGYAGGAGTCGSVGSAGWLPYYVAPSQMRYSVSGAVVRGELDENLNTAEEIAKIKAEAAAYEQKYEVLYKRAALARPVLRGYVVRDPDRVEKPKLSLKTTPLFGHLRWKFNSPFAPASRAFTKWVLSWRYT